MLALGLSRGSSPLQTPHTCCEQVASFNQIIWSDQIIEFDRSFNLYLIWLYDIESKQPGNI